MIHKTIKPTIFCLFILFAVSVSAFTDTFCDMLLAGQIAEAKKQFPERIEDPWMSKLYLGLGNSDALKSINTLDVIQNHGTPTDHCANVIYNRLAGYNFLTGKLKNFNEQGTFIAIVWANSANANYDAFTKRLLMASGQPMDEGANAKPITAKQYDDLAKEVDRDDSLWLMLDKAQMLLDAKKDKDAAKILKAISNRDDGEQVPAALYVQIKAAFQNKKSDEALRLLGIMQEAYPNAIGLDALSATLVGDTDEAVEETTEPEAERLTKTVYSVQMGVFSSKANAQVLVKELESYKQKVEITPRVISGKEYYVVYAGKFSRYDDATAFKQKLETARKESYQVIAR